MSSASRGITKYVPSFPYKSIMFIIYYVSYSLFLAAGLRCVTDDYDL